jgi:hypothetical protein
MPKQSTTVKRWSPEQEIEWEDPPALRPSGRHGAPAREAWMTFRTMLSQHPNKWAIWSSGRKYKHDVVAFCKTHLMDNMVCVSRRRESDGLYALYCCWPTDPAELGTFGKADDGEKHGVRAPIEPKLAEPTVVVDDLVSDKRKGGAIAPVIPPETSDELEVWGWMCASCPQWRESAAKLKAHTRAAHGRPKLTPVESLEPVLIPVEFQGPDFRGG